MAFWFASEIMPASAITVTSGELVGGHELLDNRQHGLGLGPSNALTRLSVPANQPHSREQG
jgi:hypothetical protein